MNESALGGGGKEESVPGRKKSVETNTATSSHSERRRDRQERRGRWETPKGVTRSMSCETAAHLSLDRRKGMKDVWKQEYI